jgi:HD-GYP domain-containing protein (c-di-GMP phosphodiesterase class II)
MLLGRDLYDDKYRIFLREGAKQSHGQIESIRRQGFAGVYILDVYSNDIVVDPIVADTEYIAAAQAVTEYTNKAMASAGGADARSSSEDYLKVIEPVLETLRGKPVLLMENIDMKPFTRYEFCHAAMVMILSIAIGIKLNMTDEQLVDLGSAALLHDIGTAFLPEDILNRPGRLTDEEFDLVKGHVRKGYDYMVNNLSLSEAASVGAMQHHENYDGTGYPDGLRRKNISLYGRIIAVTDVYDALVSKRAFRAAMYPMQAVEIVQQQSDRKFDPDVVKALESVVAPFPPGTTVQLKTGEVCIVKKNYAEDLWRPQLWQYDERAKSGQTIDLHQDKAYENTRIIKMLDI